MIIIQFIFMKKQIKNGKIEFDKLFATPESMPHLK